MHNERKQFNWIMHVWKLHGEQKNADLNNFGKNGVCKIKQIILYINTAVWLTYLCILEVLVNSSNNAIHVWASLVAQSLQCRRPTFDPWDRKIPWRRKLQLTPVCLPENSMDRGAWQATDHGVKKNQTRPSKDSFYTWYWKWTIKWMDL